MHLIVARAARDSTSGTAVCACAEVLKKAARCAVEWRPDVDMLLGGRAKN
ncbi:MAG: hypothetical protein LH603_18005 [Pseudonocardia sp.]|nr:hypothetical protein [Pseudonocardia sp.]